MADTQLPWAHQARGIEVANEPGSHSAESAPVRTSEMEEAALNLRLVGVFLVLHFLLALLLALTMFAEASSSQLRITVVMLGLSLFAFTSLVRVRGGAILATLVIVLRIVRIVQLAPRALAPSILMLLFFATMLWALWCPAGRLVVLSEDKPRLLSGLRQKPSVTRVVLLAAIAWTTIAQTSALISAARN